ncbi:MAG: universal stress protein [Chitinophagaceae bacterium]|nr:universal stress protein [Chitinophagaceae bacterium]
MKKIIAPVDFSSAAENSAIFAGKLAEFYNAELWLYYAYELVAPFGEYGYSAVTPLDMENAAKFELAEFKKKIESQIKTAVTINIKADNASLNDGLTAFCDELQPDMVVMGLSGKNALTRLVVGSNTIRAIQNLKYPVLVVPPKAEFLPVRKIGFACDYKR